MSETLFLGEEAEGEPVFRAPPVDDGDSGQGDGPDWKGVFGV